MISSSTNPVSSQPSATDTLPDEKPALPSVSQNNELNPFQRIEKIDDEKAIVEILAQSLTLNDSQLVPTFSEVFRIDGINLGTGTVFPNRFKMISENLLFYWNVRSWSKGRPNGGQLSSFDELTINKCRIGKTDLKTGSAREFNLADDYTDPDIVSNFTFWMFLWDKSPISNQFKLNDILVSKMTNNSKLILAGGGKNQGSSLGLRVTPTSEQNFKEYFSYSTDEGVKEIVELNEKFYVALTYHHVSVLNRDFEEVCRIDAHRGCIAVLNLNSIAIANNEDAIIHIFTCNDAGKLTFVRSWKAHDVKVGALLALPNGYLASGGDCDGYNCTDGTIKIWNIKNGSLVNKLSPEIPRKIKKLAMLPNGWLCASGIGEQNKISIWDIEKNQLVKEERGSGFDVTLNYLVIHGYFWEEEKYYCKFLSISTHLPKFVNVKFRAIASEVRKFRFFQLHNILKANGQYIDLSSQQITDDDVTMVVMLLKYNKFTKELNLSDNPLTARSIEKITDLLSFTIIQRLILRKVKMKQFGFKTLKDYIVANNGNVEYLDLADNKIELDYVKLSAAKNELEDSGCVIDLSLNYLSDDCNNMLTDQDVTFQKNLPTFFKSKPQTSISQFNSDFPLSLTEWVVCFVSEKTKQHAYVLVEGIKANGQIFLERYHIVPTTPDGIDCSPGKARVKLDVVKPTTHEVLEDFYFQSFKINATQGRSLRESVVSQQAEEVNFLRIGSYAGSKVVNCVDWCINLLAEINITVERTLIPYPNNVARGYSFNCVVS